MSLFTFLKNLFPNGDIKYIHTDEGIFQFPKDTTTGQLDEMFGPYGWTE